MADQPTKAMTLREAVEITRVDRDTYAERAWLNSFMVMDRDESKRDDKLDANSIEAAAYARWDRARAIVDAAVEAHEAKVECDRRWQNRDSTHEGIVEAAEASHAAEARLRALERGEDPKP